MYSGNYNTTTDLERDSDDGGRKERKYRSNDPLRRPPSLRVGLFNHMTSTPLSMKQARKEGNTKKRVNEGTKIF